METKILFIRHGHSEANEGGFWGGQVNVALTQDGEEQAEKAAKYVTEKYKIDAIYASTLKRAITTAEPVAKILNQEIFLDKRLCEIYGGDWEGISYQAIKEQAPKQFELWREDMSKVSPPNGESVFDVQKRGYEAIKEICENNQGKTIVIVSHRVMLRTLQCLWESKPLTEINRCQWIDNCAVSEVIYKEGKLIPVKINQKDFLGDSQTTAKTLM